MSYLVGKRVKTTSLSGVVTTGLVVESAFDTGGLDRDESFDILILLDSGAVHHHAMVHESGLEIISSGPMADLASAKEYIKHLETKLDDARTSLSTECLRGLRDGSRKP